MYIINLTEEQIALVREEYLKGEKTVKEIAELVGVSEDTVRRKAKSLNLAKTRKTIWTKDKIKWLQENYNLNYKVLKSHLKMDNETIRLKLIELGIERDTKHRPYKVDMSDKEFLADLDDPTLTAPDIVEKYKEKFGVGESRIHQLRKQRGIKLRVNTLKRISSAEAKVIKVLNKLDYLFKREMRIGKYSVDFYLGQKLCIEVQGEYWHNLPERKERDKRKKKFLESQGYKVLYLWENSLQDAEKDILSFIKSQGLPLS